MKNRVYILVCILVGLMLFSVWFFGSYANYMRLFFIIPILGLIVFQVLCGKSKKKILMFFKILLFLLLCFDLWSYRPRAFRDAESADLGNYYDPVCDDLSILQPDEGDMFRIYGIRTEGYTPYPYNAANICGFYDIRGLGNVMPYKLFVSKIYQLNNDYHNLLNVKYLLVEESGEDKLANYISESVVKVAEVDEIRIPPYTKNEKKKVYVYENKNRFGYAWMVDDYLLVANEEEAEEAINNTSLNEFAIVNTETISEDSLLDLEEMKNSDSENLTYDIELLEYDSNYVSLKVDSDKDGILILSEQYFLGWEVYVNDIEKEIFEVDYFLRGSFLEKGENFVEYRYSPKSFYLGVALMLSGLMIVLFGSLYCLRKK